MIKINPDKELAKAVKQAIIKNEGYCCCSLYKTKDTKCPCKKFRQQSYGTCDCGLYIKEK